MASPTILVVLALLPGRPAPQIDGASTLGGSPLSIEDALFRIPDVAGKVVTVSDADGDGLADVVIARGDRRGSTDRIELVSSKGGALIRSLWKSEGGARTARPIWRAGGDADGDLIPDLLLGIPDESGQAGKVTLISGETGTLLLCLEGSRSPERFGTSLAWLGDTDGDGCDDFAVGAIQYDPALPLFDHRQVTSYRTSYGDEAKLYMTFLDGREVEASSFLSQQMLLRSPLPGFVSLHSGRDGSRLWRVDGALGGNGFGARACAAGDLDRDGAQDLLVQCEKRSLEPALLLSGMSGKELARIAHRRGDVGSAGDLDADGATDFYLDTEDLEHVGRSWSVRLVSGATHEPLYDLEYPDWWSEYGVTVPMGDLDGDGHADLALGDANFNLPDADDMVDGAAVDLSEMTLEEADSVVSEPRNAFSWESGCALVYSGRTRKPIFGVWAPPGSAGGLGLEVTALPDVSGDGHPDVLVTDERAAYAFAGPGPARE